MIESLSFFLLNFYDDLPDKTKIILRYFNFLSTERWRDHLLLLGQSQNEIELLKFLLKKPLRSLDMVIECNWYQWIDVSKICLAAEIVSVIMII